MYTMTRPQRPGDRSRRSIKTPRESVVPVINDGIVTVKVASMSAVKALSRRKHGFILQPPVADAPAAKDPPKTKKSTAPKSKGASKSKGAAPPIDTPKPSGPAPSDPKVSDR